MTITAVNFLTETSSAAVNAARREIKDFYRPDVTSDDRGDWNAGLNAVLPADDQITAAQRWSRSREIYALLNSPDALALTAATEGWQATNAASVFTTHDGSTLATPGAAVGRIEGGQDIADLLQSSASLRPVYVRRPAGGIRNRANGSADPSNNAVWSAGATTNGVTHTRIGTGADANGPWADYTVSGTATANTTFLSHLSSFSRVAAAIGQTYTASFRAFRTAGTEPPAGSGARAEVVEEIAPTTFNATAASAAYGGTDPTILTVSKTLSVAGTNQVRASFSIFTANGATVDYTVRIQAVQFEAGSTRTAYQANLSQFDVTEAGVRDLFEAQFDLSDDVLAVTLADGLDGDLFVIGDVGCAVYPVTVAPAGTLSIGPTTTTGGAAGLLSTLSGGTGRIAGVYAKEGGFTAAELLRLETYAIAIGCGPIL
jgi:hypothetical protein